MRQDRKVMVRAMVRTADDYGGYTDAPADVGEWWVKVEPLEGTEQMQAMQAGLQRPHRFTGHYRAGLTGATELLYDGRRFDVNSVTDPDAKHRELVILADEMVAGS